MLSMLLKPPATGRELARARVILGCSVRQVARLLGINHASLLRPETERDAIAPDLAAARGTDLRDTEMAAMIAVLSQESD